MGAKTNTRIDAMVPWHGDFSEASPLFNPLRPLAERFCDHVKWPTLEDLQGGLDALADPIRMHSGQILKIVSQAGKPERFEEHYAPRIYYRGEIQTRTENWHDFFQYLTWFIFPKTKAVINAIHIPRAKARLEAGGEIGRRSPVENMLSLFDEGGAVIVSSDESLLQLVREFKWKELFWRRRGDLKDKFECITFGHAMYEKALAPYIGMTANTILIPVEKEYFLKPQDQRVAEIDTRLADSFSTGESYTQPRDLQPFPILGMPGWDANNSHEAYYDNADYFRPGRRQHGRS